MKKFKVFVALFGSCILSTGVRAAPVELIANGGFEAGFASWTKADLPGSGSWFTHAGGPLPLSGLPEVGPAGWSPLRGHGPGRAWNAHPGAGFHSGRGCIVRHAVIRLVE